MAFWSGWVATLTIVLAALVPIVQRIRAGKRGAPGSKPIQLHVTLGIATAAVAFVHTLMVIPALGTPAAIAGGVMALLPAGIAFFILIAHAGIGLQLRNPKLRDRTSKRRTHATTAVLIATAVTAHVFLLERVR